jgi:selenocysteine-specific elongation factor
VDMLPADGRADAVERISAKIRKVLASTKFAAAPFIVLSAAPGGGGKMGAAAPLPSAGAPGGGPAAAAGDGAASAAAPTSKKQDETVRDLVRVMRDTVAVPRRDASGPFLFAVDHCFPIRGQGTVLTGTVLAGACRVNDTVELAELRQERKIKSMQMFHKPVTALVQGDRAGICVTGLDASLVERGLACTPGSGACTTHAAGRVLVDVRDALCLSSASREWASWLYPGVAALVGRWRRTFGCGCGAP